MGGGEGSMWVGEGSMWGRWVRLDDGEQLNDGGGGLG